MLAFTDEAVQAIRILEERGGAAVRISAAPTSVNGSAPALQLELAPDPGNDDEVIETDGAVLFLDPSAAAFDDRVLDAKVDPDGVRFTLHDRDEPG